MPVCLQVSGRENEQLPGVWLQGSEGLLVLQVASNAAAYLLSGLCNNAAAILLK